MTHQAQGTFTVSSWTEDTYEQLDGEAKLTRATIVQDFIGDLQAGGVAELLMCYADGSTATIVGFQRFEGRLAGHEGSFVTRFVGDYDGTDATANLSVVAGSGTGELRGLLGQGTSVAGHEPPGSYTFDYTLE